MKSLAELPGLRVVLVRDVDRYPHFMVAAGATGIVTVADECFISVKMDQHIDGAEGYDNEIYWEWHGEDAESGIPEFWLDCRPEGA